MVIIMLVLLLISGIHSLNKGEIIISAIAVVIVFIALIATLISLK